PRPTPLLLSSPPPPPPTPTLFPYTTLFRSRGERLRPSPQQRAISRRTGHRPPDPVADPRHRMAGTPVRVPRTTTHRHRHPVSRIDRKSTRLNSSHLGISYAVFCLKKKNKDN